MSLQTKIEQTAKEYFQYKELLDERIKNAEEKKKNFAEKRLQTEDEDFHADFFDTFYSVELLAVDTNQMLVKLYHQVKLAEDLVEIPQEIKTAIEIYKPTSVYTTKGEIVNQDFYNRYKESYIQQALEFEKLTAKNV